VRFYVWRGGECTCVPFNVTQIHHSLCFLFPILYAHYVFVKVIFDFLFSICQGCYEMKWKQLSQSNLLVKRWSYFHCSSVPTVSIACNEGVSVACMHFSIHRLIVPSNWSWREIHEKGYMHMRITLAHLAKCWLEFLCDIYESHKWENETIWLFTVRSLL
jgi:hypothetical protein